MPNGPANNTRGKDKPSEEARDKMNADELEALRNQLALKERRIREESAAVEKNRATFDKEVSEVQAQIDNERAELDQYRLQLKREREEFDKLLKTTDAQKEEPGRADTEIFTDLQETTIDTRPSPAPTTTPIHPQRSTNPNLPLNPLAASWQNDQRNEFLLTRGNPTEHEDTRLVIKAAIDAIPNFDGENVPVLQFTRACNRGRDLVPDRAEKTFAKLIISKLRGRAYTAVEDQVVDTVTDICNRLKDVFGPHHTIDHYRGEMTNIFMKPNEDILQYISRVKDLRTAIIECDRVRPDIAGIDNLTKKSFIRGLVSSLRTEIRASCSRSLHATFDEAIRYYKELELDKQRYERCGREEKQVRFSGYGPHNNSRSDSRFSRSPSPYRNDAYQNRSRADTYRVESSSSRQRENSPYQIRTDAFINKPRDNRYPEPPRNVSYRDVTQPPPNRSDDSRHVHRDTYTPPQRRENNFASPRASAKFCNYCKTPGHDIHECRKREFNNRIREQPGNGPTLPSATALRREASIKQSVQTIATEPSTETARE